jgi:tetratricopeptide (TPR) repeat protein
MLRRTLLTSIWISLVIVGVSEAQHQHHDHGEVGFAISCNDRAEEFFHAGLAHLHHMMYEQARPLFEQAAEADPECAMAHWGIAMTSFQPLWHPTPAEDLERGKAAVERAQTIGAQTEREEAYIAAVEAFFTDPEPAIESRARDHAARLEAWTSAQRAVHEAYPEDVDAAAFYALSEVCYATTQFSPDQDRDFSRELRAGEIIERYFEDHPEHPGLFHYLIHAYDSPKLAHRALEAARGYDEVAPQSVHALHMPSHIFVRLGKWEETIEWNNRSAEAAMRVMDEDAHASAHYVHALDYMMYGYLQLGDEENARKTLERIHAVDEVYPAPFAGYNLAAPQARYYLELQKWEDAARIEPGQPAVLPWENYPTAQALIHYAIGLGAARSGDIDRAEAERDRINEAVRQLREGGDEYWAHMTEALGKAVDAWILYDRGETEAALTLIDEAARMEEAMDKHAITPGEVFPVRELHAEMLLMEGRNEEATSAFQRSLERTPNRANALRGLARAERR